jgi:hypothetical protein
VREGLTWQPFQGGDLKVAVTSVPLWVGIPQDLLRLPRWRLRALGRRGVKFVEI